MEWNKQLLSLDMRQLVHSLSITHRTSGLSPPEEELMIVFEAEENSEANQEDELL